jgi:F-type H+-transporting ATPase subunit alpha
MSVAEMGIVLYSVNEGYLKEVEVEKVKDFEKSLLSFMSSEYGDLMKSITISGDYNEEIENAFKAALDKFMKTQTW